MLLLQSKWVPIFMVCLFSVHEYIFRVSLSKPHTSVTALHMHVCIYAWTDHLPENLNERIQIFHYDFTKINIEKQWRATVQVQRQEPRAMMTELEARMALVCASTDDSRPLTGCTNLIWTVVNRDTFPKLLSEEAHDNLVYMAPGPQTPNLQYETAWFCMQAR